MASSLVEAALGDDIAPPKTKSVAPARRRKPTKAEKEEEYPDTGDEKHDVLTDDEPAEDAVEEGAIVKAVDVARAPAKARSKSGKKKTRPPPPGATRYSRVLKCFTTAYEIAAKHEAEYSVGMQKFVYAAIKNYCGANVRKFRELFGVIKEEQYRAVGYSNAAVADDIGMD
jgi:hypothetical protein